MSKPVFVLNHPSDCNCKFCTLARSLAVKDEHEPCERSPRGFHEFATPTSETCRWCGR
jgi:hypothetical protein